MSTVWFRPTDKRRERYPRTTLQSPVGARSGAIRAPTSTAALELAASMSTISASMRVPVASVDASETIARSTVQLALLVLLMIVSGTPAVAPALQSVRVELAAVAATRSAEISPKMFDSRSLSDTLTHIIGGRWIAEDEA
jgi:hypothetical protein